MIGLRARQMPAGPLPAAWIGCSNRIAMMSQLARAGWGETALAINNRPIVHGKSTRRNAPPCPGCFQTTRALWQVSARPEGGADEWAPHDADPRLQMSLAGNS